MTPAPIALFVYKRPGHTQRTVTALRRNELAAESDLVVFCDGPTDSVESRQQVQEVRRYVATIDGFKSVRIVESTANLGLAKSIVNGVSATVADFGRVIVLEDDMVTSRHFLEFMNGALDLYESDTEVISIHGYVYPVREVLPETFFLRGADCWGWATWERGWSLYEPDGEKLLQRLTSEKLDNAFDFDGTRRFTRMLKDQIAGRNDSWAIRWYASAFLRQKLTLYPGRSLVHNIGMDASGTHCLGLLDFGEPGIGEDAKIDLIRIPVAENAAARRAISRFFRRSNNLAVQLPKIVWNCLARYCAFPTRPRQPSP